MTLDWGNEVNAIVITTSRLASPSFMNIYAIQLFFYLFAGFKEDETQTEVMFTEASLLIEDN